LDWWGYSGYCMYHDFIKRLSIAFLVTIQDRPNKQIMLRIFTVTLIVTFFYDQNMSEILEANQECLMQKIYLYPTPNTFQRKHVFKSGRPDIRLEKSHDRTVS